MATDFSMARLFFHIKQRCPGVRLAAKKFQAAEVEVIKEGTWGLRKARQSIAPWRTVLIIDSWRGPGD